jgi:transposase-like protein
MPGECTNDKKNLSHRVIEDLLAKRDSTVSYEYIRPWCIKLGQIYTRRLKRKRELTMMHSNSMQFV